MRFRFPMCFLIGLLCSLIPVFSSAQEKPAAGLPDAVGIEYFEKKIRPILVQNCYGCHSHTAKQSLGSLFLDSRQGTMQGGQHGVSIVPGDPEKSRLIEAVRYAKSDFQMPPKGKLSEKVIADLVEWVKMGAPWPEERLSGGAAAKSDSTLIEQRKRRHWAWQPVRQTPPPAVKHRDWPRTALDPFVLAKLEAKGLAPNPYADRRTLIRRASFDLIGLPPTPQEVDAFLNDTSPNAWEKVVDRLLASPHYGERWGRYWLDIARYGEDQAHSFEPRLYPQGFRYRDWVARALNSDMPYDRFVKEQIAADLLDGPDRQEQLPALGFFALGPVYYGDAKMYDQYDDRIDTLARGFLGLTVACARCHDHKYDPITQKDYYALAGVFASTAYIEVPVSETPVKDGKTEGLTNRNDKINAKQQEVDKFVAEQVQEIRNRLTPEIAKYLVAAWKYQNRRRVDPKLTVDSLAAKEGVEALVLERWMKYLSADKDRPSLAAWRQKLQQEDAHTDLSSNESALAEVRKLAGDYQNTLLALAKRREAEKAKAGAMPLEKSETAALDEVFGPEGVLTLPRDQFEKLLVGDPKMHYAVIKAELERMKMGAFVHALTEGPKPANVKVLLRGNPETPGEEAPRRFLAILAGENAPSFTQGSGRLELANAIADKSNPLTARVIVNRVWQHHIGTGLVRTTSNFGLLGEPPSHPELLDTLTAQFIAHGWSLKWLHRQILLSATYRMSSATNAHNETVDPEDRLLWRMPRRRLEIEAWRDAMLAVSNKLDETLGGPSLSLTEPGNCRRTFYAAVSRHDLDAMLRLFDFPDPNVTSDARTATTVPLQQLFVLNSEFMIRQAKAFAARINAIPGEADAARIREAYLLAYGRPPTEKEISLGLTFLQGSKSYASAPPATGPHPAGESAPKLSRWEQYAQALLSSNEFLYVD
ncbi:MAG TPA: PSD1 and planctomycete cytochrome C domain-containing protein [Chthonomonadaceae bacterium]|nr:PSD1 and planctomycete cytochrome C domain-containing protein [Chthonomonadaceae bacterium]